MNLNRITIGSLTLVAMLLMGGCSKEAAPAKAKTDSHAGEAKTAGKAPAKDEHAHKAGEKEGEHAEEGGVVKLTEAEIKDAGIRTEPVSVQPIRAQFSVSATIQPNKDRYAHVAPRISGRILSVPAKAGDQVKAGQVLAQLDSIEMGEAHSAYLQAASQESLARADFERADRLFKEQVVPEKEHLRARSEFEKARAAAQAAADKLRMMGVTASRSGAAQSSFPVVAPFAGTIIEKAAVIGELAQPDKSLFTVADLSTVWIEANLNERDLSRVTTGASAEVTVQAYPDDRFRGKVVYVSGSVDKESRTIRARIEVPNPAGKLKPEMFATARIEAETVGKGITVPAEAVSLVDGKKVVFIQEVDGFESREVEMGEDVGGRQIVKAGLHDGEKVVTAGGYAIKARLQKSKIGHGHAH